MEFIEKIRMCLAEAGFVDGVDGRLEIHPLGDGTDGLWWKDLSDRRPSDEVLWRARELAEVEDPCCLRHFEAYQTAACLAGRRLVKDCAVER